MHSAVFVTSKLPGYVKPYTYNILESCGHGFVFVHEESQEKATFCGTALIAGSYLCSTNIRSIEVIYKYIQYVHNDGNTTTQTAV
jgi:hypothetical protein